MLLVLLGGTLWGICIAGSIRVRAMGWSGRADVVYLADLHDDGYDGSGASAGVKSFLCTVVYVQVFDRIYTISIFCRDRVELN